MSQWDKSAPTLSAVLTVEDSDGKVGFIRSLLGTKAEILAVAKAVRYGAEKHEHVWVKLDSPKGKIEHSEPRIRVAQAVEMMSA